eukprot:jgi/Chrzof1/10155/Cz04g31010.t1
MSQRTPVFRDGHHLRRSLLQKRHKTENCSKVVSPHVPLLVALLLAACGIIIWHLSYLLVKFDSPHPSVKAAFPTVIHNITAEPARPLSYPVWWHAPFFTGTGYGSEAISYVVALLKTNRFRREDIWITHSGDNVVENVYSSMEPTFKKVLQEQEYNSLVRDRLPDAELNRAAIVICHTFPDCWLLAKEKHFMDVPGCPCPAPKGANGVAYRVGRTMFETAGLPAHLVKHCNAMDEIWVPTEFNKQTFTAAGVDPAKLRVVPQGINITMFDPSKYSRFNLRELGGQLVVGTESPQENTYTFVAIFKWETRKGWDILLDAYLHEFGGTENVELHIMTHAFAKSTEDYRRQVYAWLYQNFQYTGSDITRLPRVYVYSGYISDTAYPSILASADCVVLPTRGEGWGRPQMEAMAMGRPLITTNWSGPTAYINDDVAYPLRVDGVSSAEADMHSTTTDKKEVNIYFVGESWAQPSVSHLRQLMRQVVNYPREAEAKGRAARQHVLNNFTPEVLAEIIMKEIRRIEAKLGASTKQIQRKAIHGGQSSTYHNMCGRYPQLCKQGAAMSLTSGSKGIHKDEMTIDEVVQHQKLLELNRQRHKEQGNNGEATVTIKRRGMFKHMNPGQQTMSTTITELVVTEHHSAAQADTRVQAAGKGGSQPGAIDTQAQADVAAEGSGAAMISQAANAVQHVDYDSRAHRVLRPKHDAHHSATYSHTHTTVGAVQHH